MIHYLILLYDNMILNEFFFQPDDVVNVAVDKINGLLESFMGINDQELCKLSYFYSNIDLEDYFFFFFHSALYRFTWLDKERIIHDLFARLSDASQKPN